MNNAVSSQHPLRRLLDFARPYRRNIILGSVFSVCNKVFDVLPEILIGVSVDVVVNQKDSFLAKLGVSDPMQQLWALAALTVLIWVFESLFEYLYALRWRGLAQDMQHELRQAAYSHLQKLPPDFINSERSGRLMALMNEDVNQIERFLNTGANDLIQVFVSSLLVGAVFFVLTADLAVLALLPIPMILFGAFWFQKRLYPRYTAAREAAATVSNRLNNNLAGMTTIQAYTAEEFESEHVRIASNAFRERNADAIKFSAAITPVIRMAVMAGFVVTLLYGGYLCLSGKLGVGSYTVLVYLTQRLLWPMTRLADMTDLYQRAMASVNRVMDLLETALPKQSTREFSGPVKGALRFENIFFAYGDTPTLSDINIDIPAGSTIAFVGGTGSGKSTLLKLLLRFLSPDKGRILFDGQDIADINSTVLRKQLGYVAQDPFLTDGSIADNIAYGEYHADRKAVETAADAAEASEFISSLPNGFDNEVGERGTQLSGGQRQRIALARALYRNPAVLILDEATSAVDNETEAAIQRSLARVSKNRTTIIVAHRLSTVRNADMIFVIEKGRLTEQGRHQELLASDGVYASLWKLQTGEAF
ncbi:MAG TPA: ABC transporter ATP-binding protein [Arenimonas sp.]|nr:ABC transporter ATP-binding protein [Arenimonas sp.]HPW31411.1 ABC transporter ATP-binding protein [Arenimonas sp.]